MRTRRKIAILAVLALVFTLIGPKTMVVKAGSVTTTTKIEIDNSVTKTDGSVSVDVAFKDTNEANLQLQANENGHTSFNFGEDNSPKTNIVATPASTAKVGVQITAAGLDIDNDVSGFYVGGQKVMPLPNGATSAMTYATMPNAVDLSSDNIEIKVLFKSSNSGNNDPEPPAGGEGPAPADGLCLNFGGTQHDITPENKTITLTGVTDLTDVNFMVDEYVDYTDPDNPDRHPLKNVGTNSGVTDGEGRNPLEVQTISKSASSWSFNLIFHAEDDPTAANQSYAFYIRGITITTESFKGVQVSFAKTPDMYQDTVYSRTVDLTGTTEDKPAETAVYYDCGQIDLSKIGSTANVSKIETANSKESKAITVENGKVTFNSGFYDKLTLKVTLADGTVGYVEITRLGISLDVVRPTTLNPRNEYRKTPFHGSQNGTDVTGATGADKVNVVATFYYDASSSYKDFDMVANLTFADDHCETKVVSGYGETSNASDPSLKAGDYLVWSGASDSAAPVKVSVTAVKHGATSSAKFGGALFGGGSGITVEKITTKIPN